MIKDADAGAIILAIVGSLLVGGVAYALQRLSFYRNEKDIIPKIKSGELTEKDFVQAYREQAINRIKINEDKIIAEAEGHLFSTEDAVNLTKVELLKLKRELYRAKSINDLISIFPNDVSLKRMKYLFDKSKLTKDSKGVKTMNLKRYIDAAVRREVRRRLYNDWIESLSGTVRKALQALSNIQPQNQQQEQTIKNVAPMIKRIPYLWKTDEDSMGSRAFDTCGKAMNMLSNAGIHDRKLMNLLDDIYSNT